MGDERGTREGAERRGNINPAPKTKRPVGSAVGVRPGADEKPRGVCCPICSGAAAVDRTVREQGKTVRYRRCVECDFRFKTDEVVVDAPPAWDAA